MGWKTILLLPFLSWPIRGTLTVTPTKFNIDLEKWWLEDDPFLLGFGNFSGVNSLLNFGWG